MFQLALRSLEDNRFKTWVVAVCAALVAAFVIAATLVLGGARQSLDLAMQRMGADIIVVPQGVEARVENALLMGAPVRSWMPESTLAQVRGVEGVAVASPQIYLATLRGATCCSVPEMFLIAYDPATDFTLKPWLDTHLEGGLAPGQVIGGALVYVPPEDDAIYVYGTPVDLVGNLGRTGAGLDQTMFMTMDTARRIARDSATKADEPLVIEEGQISAVLIRTTPGADPAEVAQAIREALPGVTPLEAASLFGAQRSQMAGLSRSIAVLVGIVWLLAIVLTGIAFAIAADERRREMGVLRALGATRGSVARTLLAEVAVLAFGGGVFGAGMAAFAVWLFRAAIVNIMRMPFVYPGAGELLALLGATLAVTLFGVLLAAALPTLRISTQEPALAMRE